MMMDPYWVDDSRDRTENTRYLIGFRDIGNDDIKNTFRQRVIANKPNSKAYSYGYLEHRLAEGITFIDLMYLIAEGLAKHGNVYQLRVECLSRLEFLSTGTGLNKVIYYQLNIGALTTIVTAMNSVLEIFNIVDQRILRILPSLQITSRSGDCDTSALLMHLPIPRTVRNLTIISYPFSMRGCSRITSAEYKDALVRTASGLPIEEREVALIAAAHIDHFIATTHWHDASASYGLINSMLSFNDNNRARDDIFQTRGIKNMFLLYGIMSIILLPLVIVYNQYRTRQWGWMHAYQVGVKRTDTFRKEIQSLYKNFETAVTKDHRMWLETLALPLAKTGHMLPENRIRFIKLQARHVINVLGTSDSLMRLSDMITRMEDVEPELQDDSYHAIVRILNTLAVHMDDDRELSPNVIAVSLYWISKELLGQPNIRVRHGSVMTDLSTWASV